MRPGLFQAGKLSVTTPTPRALAVGARSCLPHLGCRISRPAAFVSVLRLGHCLPHSYSVGSAGRATPASSPLFLHLGRWHPPSQGSKHEKPQIGAQEAYINTRQVTLHLRASFPGETVLNLESVSPLKVSSKCRLHVYFSEKRAQAFIRFSKNSQPPSWDQRMLWNPLQIPRTGLA